MSVLLTALVYAGVANAQELFKATLTGDREVPPVTTDTTGKAFLTLNKAETEIEFELHVNNGVRITQSHIHCAQVGVNGPGYTPLALRSTVSWWVTPPITDASIGKPGHAARQCGGASAAPRKR